MAQIPTNTAGGPIQCYPVTCTVVSKTLNNRKKKQNRHIQYSMIQSSNTAGGPMYEKSYYTFGAHSFLGSNVTLVKVVVIAVKGLKTVQ